jgi:mannose-6-phosphate isomerase-like protein (cupin superfamily)
MAAIRFAHGGDLVWLNSDAEPEEDSREAIAKLTERERNSSYAMHHPGGEDDLQLFEVKVPAGGGTEVHAHDESEIIYVVAGEMKVGAHTLRAGSSVHIPARTLYSFTAGDEGLRFLNFRARRDMTYITKDELMRDRRQAASPA